MENIEGKSTPKPLLCSHSVEQGNQLNQFIDKIMSSFGTSLRCQECDIDEIYDPSYKEKRADLYSILWICLDCYETFCEGYSDSAAIDSHIQCHAINSDHPLAFPITPWCFACNSHQNITAELEENKDVNSAKDVKEEMMEMEKEKIKILPSGNVTGYRVKMMKNFGNKCFYNSVLQNFLSMNRLRDDFFKLASSDTFLQLVFSDSPPIITMLLLNLFKDSVTNAILLDTSRQQALFYSVCSTADKFKSNQEEDCHEFLKLFISRLLQEGTSCVNDIFGGQLRSTLCHELCGQTSIRDEEFLDLSLPIPAAREEDGGSFPAKVYDAKIYSPPSDASTGGILQYKDTVTPDSSSSDSVNAPIKSWIKKCRVVSSDKVDGMADEQDPKYDGDDYYHNYTNKEKEPQEDPEDCCRQHPCTCNKDSIEIPKLPESQQLLSDKKGLPEDQDVPMKEDHQKNYDDDKEGPSNEDPEDCCGQHPCICNKDSSEVPELPEGQQLLSDKEGLTEDQDVPMLENFLEEKSSENKSNLDVDDEPTMFSDSEVSNRADVKVPVNAKKRCRSVRHHVSNCNSKAGIHRSNDYGASLSRETCSNIFTMLDYVSFEGGIPRSNDDGGPLSIKRPLEFRMLEPVEHKAGIQKNNDGGGSLSIDSCLDLFTRLEPVEGNDTCTDCLGSEKGKSKSETCGFEVDDSKDEGTDTGRAKRKVGATKQLLILKAPPILTINLKRFVVDEYNMYKKRNCHVNFQEQLDLTPYIHHSCEDRRGCLYRLIGVVEHMGSSMGTGHYVAYVRGVRSEVEGSGGPAWFRASDDIVQEVQLQQVLESEAYILFYEQM